MSSGTSPETTSSKDPVERQLDAYNRQALEEFLACYADSAQLLVDGVTAASGKEALREIYARQFAQTPVKATSLGRLRQGEWVVDHERVEAPSLPTTTVLALYRVRDGLIDQVQFLGQQAEM
ncbi:nuclear transport factor 2 family protein [Streptomyces sp. NPDC006385]|uniref:nuclear transport factor 2 family protein n=1 Tax=Streptomyces sp. NPDC006385 TaxID=3156761 RepID=UPI0033B10883